MNKIEEYYNKFNEDKRLSSRHGQVEFATSMHYIHKELGQLGDRQTGGKRPLRILDVGAGCGAYSIPLADEGYEVHALELVKHNVARLKAKSDKVDARQGNALKLTRKYERNYFDLLLVFGPMYHLFTYEDKLSALKQAMEVTAPCGVILVAYCMEDYALVRHGFMDGNIGEALERGKVTRSETGFALNSEEEDLYDYMQLSDIDRLYKEAGLKRKYIFTPDGPTDYIRKQINSLSEEEFKLYKEYVLSISQRQDILGASSHTVDVLMKQQF